MKAYILIGPSGSGKSTYTKQFTDDAQIDACVFSLDACRLSFLGAEKFNLTREESIEHYKAAFNYANANSKEFDSYVAAQWKKAMEHNVVIVDNTNLSRKSRARWIADLRKKKFTIVCVEFLVSLNTILERQATRQDKSIPVEIVRQMYFRQEAALVGSECDSVVVVYGE